MSAGGPQRGPGDHDLCGVYYAQVVRNDDPDGPGGRVKVRFPWLPDSMRDQSYWAQLAVPLVGDGFGAYTVPEIKDQVLVVFVGGDIRQPVVIGGAWSQRDVPPETNEHRSNDFRLIKSRSGHRAILDDSDSVKVVVSDCSNRNVVTVGKFARSGDSPNAIAAAVPGGIGSGESTEGVSVSSTAEGATFNVWCPSGELHLESGKNVEISSRTTLEVKGGNALSVKSKQVRVGAAAAMNVDGNPLRIGKG